MIEWSWRIEDETSILCGSWSGDEGWQDVFLSLIGRRVEGISVFGRLPELSISLSGKRYVASFMTAEGQPAWTIFKRSREGSEAEVLSVENGIIVEGDEARPASS